MNDRDRERIAKLPKWAQELMKLQERVISDQRKLINRLDRDQKDRKPDWHNWEFYDEYGGIDDRDRYIAANSIRVSHNGLDVSMTARRGTVTIRFDVDPKSEHYGVENEAVIIPDARNSISILRVPKPTEL